jgi:hypothetical protein
MAMGKRERNRQPPMWVMTTDLPTAASHPFYQRLNDVLRDQRFDDFAEAACSLSPTTRKCRRCSVPFHSSFEDTSTRVMKSLPSIRYRPL